jgi:pilus assembly protein CpaF
MAGRFRFSFNSAAPARQEILTPIEPEPMPVIAPPPDEDEGRPALLNEKVDLHGKIIDEFNLAFLDKMSRQDLMRQISGYVSDYVHSQRIPLNQRELEAFTEEILDEMTGLGPIEPLLKDPTVNDILINGHSSVYVERFGQIEPTRVRFKDEAHLVRIINKIVAAVGRRVDESSPMVDARLADGSRVNVAVRPVAIDGPLVSIRKFAKRAFSIDRLIQVGSLRPQMAEVLRAAVQGRDLDRCLRRHRQREDDDAQRVIQLHLAQGAASHDRGLGGVAAPTAACRTSRDTASERRGQG